MNQPLIKVGICIAYDWDFLRYSIPFIYEDSDYICLSLDSERTSWTLHPFAFDEVEFRDLVHELDPQRKIHIYEDNFHLFDLTPKENEVRQRNKMADFMGDGGWHLQLDTDEYFIDFTGFVRYLKSAHFSRPVNICCPLITLFKKVDGGYLWIKNEKPSNQDTIAIATNAPKYQFGRRNGHFNILTNYPLLHQSWAREVHEIAEKVENWGHSRDFDVKKYLEFWKDLSKTNYQAVHNFHPINPPQWEILNFQEGTTISLLIDIFRQKKPIVFPWAYLSISNSIWISRGKKMMELVLNSFK